MKTRREFLISSAAVVGASLILPSTIGCDAQQTAAELITTVGNAVSSLESIEGNTAIVAQIQKDTAAAATAVMNWKSGTPSQDVVAILNIVRDDLYLVPISSLDQSLIDLAIGAVEEIIIQIGGSAAAVAIPKVQTRNARSVSPHLSIKSSKDFKKSWNALIAQQPKLASASIK